MFWKVENWNSYTRTGKTRLTLKNAFSDHGFHFGQMELSDNPPMQWTDWPQIKNVGRVLWLWVELRYPISFTSGNFGAPLLRRMLLLHVCPSRWGIVFYHLLLRNKWAHFIYLPKNITMKFCVQKCHDVLVLTFSKCQLPWPVYIFEQTNVSLSNIWSRRFLISN